MGHRLNSLNGLGVAGEQGTSFGKRTDFRDVHRVSRDNKEGPGPGWYTTPKTDFDFKDKGGIKLMGEAMGRGMALVMSMWDDHDVNMLWLDSTYPVPDPPGSTNAALRWRVLSTAGCSESKLYDDMTFELSASDLDAFRESGQTPQALKQVREVKATCCDLLRHHLPTPSPALQNPRSRSHIA